MLDAFNYLFNGHLNFILVTLPLGISFFTFNQIAFLVDCYQAKAKAENFTQYLLFVTYFPHLIAGPILHYKPMISQFKNSSINNFNSKNVVCGIIFLIIGLTKKVLIADELIPHVKYIFDIQDVSKVTFLDSYLGVLSYTFQLYFDFSGYCDMAIGISKMFNIDLPINFNSPYKAKTIIDFWRRWHITLSAFLKDYLYIKLGGNQKGKVRRYLNLFITMLLGGIWHGSGLNFIIWGGLHGLFLIINHGWNSLKKKHPIIEFNSFFAHSITFLSIMFAWIFFRADNLYAAKQIIEKLIAFDELYKQFIACGKLIINTPLNEFFSFNFFISLKYIFTQQYSIGIIIFLLILILTVLFAPNTQQISNILLNENRFAKNKIFIIMIACFSSIFMFYIIFNFTRESSFLYFKF